MRMETFVLRSAFADWADPALRALYRAAFCSGAGEKNTEQNGSFSDQKTQNTTSFAPAAAAAEAVGGWLGVAPLCISGEIGVDNAVAAAASPSKAEDAFVMAAPMMVGSSLAIVGIAVLYSLFVYDRDWSRSYKIQARERWPDPKLTREAWLSLMVENVQFMITTPLVWAFLVGYNIVASPEALEPERIPSDLWVFLRFVVSMLCTDVTFYWFHRFLHTNKAVYKAVHKKHHKFYVSTTVATGYAHPVETLLNVISTLSGPLLMRYHSFELGVYLFFRFWESVDAHSGYALPFSPWSLTGQAVHHDFHHSHNKGMYGVFAFGWDRVMGSDKDYKKWLSKGEKCMPAGSEEPHRQRQHHHPDHHKEEAHEPGQHHHPDHHKKE